MGKETDFSSPQFLPEHSFSSVFSLTPPLITIMCVIFWNSKNSHTHLYLIYTTWKDGKERYPFIQMRALSPKEINWCAQSHTRILDVRARSTRSSGPEAITPFTHQTMLVWSIGSQIFRSIRITWEAFSQIQFYRLYWSKVHLDKSVQNLHF